PGATPAGPGARTRQAGGRDSGRVAPGPRIGSAGGPPAAAPAPDMTTPRYVRRGPLRAWLAPGVDLEHTIAADGDPDHLLTRPDCRIVKLQRKIVVGRVESAGDLALELHDEIGRAHV